MTHVRSRLLERGLGLFAVGSLALTLGACSSDSSDAASKSSSSSAPSASSSSAPADASSSSPVPYPSTTSIGMSGSPLGQALTQEQQGELNQLVGLPAPMAGGTGRGGSSASFIVAAGRDSGQTGQVREAERRETITVACLGASEAVPLVVTLTPNADAPKSTVVKTMTCPAGADQGHGMKIYSGKVSGPMVRVKNTGSRRMAVAVGFLDS